LGGPEKAEDLARCSQAAIERVRVSDTSEGDRTLDSILGGQTERRLT
jgi:hypothetical protein